MAKYRVYYDESKGKYWLKKKGRFFWGQVDALVPGDGYFRTYFTSMEEVKAFIDKEKKYRKPDYAKFIEELDTETSSPIKDIYEK